MTSKRRRRRLVRFALALLLAGFGGLAVFVAFLHTPVGRDGVRRLLETAVAPALGVRLRLGALRYRLWACALDAEGLHLEREGFVLDVAAIRLRWGPRSGLRLRLEAPRLVVRDTGAPGSPAPAEGLRARPWTVLERFAEAEVTACRIELQGPSGVSYLVLGSLNAVMRESQGRREVRIGLEDGSLTPAGGARLAPLTGTAQLRLEGRRLVIDALRLTTRGSSLDLRGALERLGPATAAASARLDADGALVGVFAPDSGVSGRIRAEADLQLDGSLSGRLRASSPALTVQGVGPWVASLRGHFSEGRLVIEAAEALGYDGRLGARGTIASDATELVLRVRDVDVATLARDAVGASLPVRTRLRAQLHWTAPGLDLERGRGEGQLTLASPPAPRDAPGLPLTGATRILVTGGELRLRELQLAAREARFEGDVVLTPAGELRGRHRTDLPLASLAPLLADIGVRTDLPPLLGRLAVDGRLDGTIASPRLTMQLFGEGLTTVAAAQSASASLRGDGVYADGRLTLGSLVVRSSGGGACVVTGAAPLTAAGGDWDVLAELQALDLAPLLGLAGLEGHGPLDGRVRVQGSRAQPAAHAELRTHLVLAGVSDPIAASFSGSSRGSRLEVERLEAELAGGRLHASGSFDAQTRAIEASARAAGIRLSRLSLPAALDGLDGSLGLDLAVAGSLDAPAGELRAALEGARFGERPLPGLTLTASSDGRRLDLAGASRDPESPATETPLLRGGGPTTGDWPLEIYVDTAALPLHAVLDVLPAAAGLDATLSTRGVVRVDLPACRPMDLRYAGERLTASGRVRDLEWRTEPFAIQGGSREITVAGLKLVATSSSSASSERERLSLSERESADTRPAAVVASARADEARSPEEAPAEEAPPGVRAGGTLTVDGRLPIAEDAAFDLSLEAALDLAALRQLADSRLAGHARTRLRVRGGATAPLLEGEVTLTQGRGRLGQVRLSRVELEARLRGARAEIERLSLEALGGRLTARGAFPLRRLAASEAPARLQVEARDLDLVRLAVSGARRGPDEPSFFVSLSGDVTARAPRLDEVSARGLLTRADQVSPEGRITLQQPAAWRFDRGRFEQDPLRLSGPLGTIEARAEARLLGDAFSGAARVTGPFDLRMIGAFLPDTTLSGPARIDLRAHWDPTGARLDGGLSVEDGRLTLEALAFTLSGLRGDVRLLGDRATVDARAESGDGGVVLSGGMSFGPGLLGSARLQLDAERVLIAYPEGFRARAGGRIELSGEPGAYRVKGDVGLTQAYYTADFDQQSRSLDRLEQQLDALRGDEPVGASLPLAVRVRLVDPLRIRNSRARLDVLGEFSAQGTLAQPSATGQVSLLEGGEVRIRRGSVRVQEGRVELNGFPEGNPELALSGVSRVAGVEMDVRASGTFEELQLDITSANRPDLSQTDLVSLLLTGRTEQAVAAQSAAIVAEELAAALGGVVQKGVGELLLVDVGPDRSLLTDDVDPAQRFHLGARLRQDLVVLYSTRLDGTGRRWIVEWNPRGGRLRLRALDDLEEGLAFEISDRWSFDLLRRRRTAARAPRERAKLEALSFQGATPLPADELAQATGLEVGRGYSALRFEQAADALRSRLVEEGFLSASVGTVAAPVAGDSGSVELIFRVDAGPRIRAKWTGDDPGGKVRSQALDAWPAYASPESAAAAVARTARVLLQAKRYYLAAVEHEVHGEGELAEISFHVERGPKGTGVELDFEGNSVLDDAALRALLPEPGSREFFFALAGRGARLSSAVRIAYAQVGHLRTRALRPRSGYDATSGRLHVVVPVRERGLARVSRLSLPSELVSTTDGRPALTLREGAPFALDAYIADREAIADWYREAGWMEARVRGVLEPAGEDLRVSFEVAPGPRLRAGELRIEGDGRTRPALVRRAVVVEQGALVRPRELSESRARLSELGVFRSVDVRPVPLRDITRRRKAGAAGAETGPPSADGGVSAEGAGQADGAGAPPAPAPDEGDVVSDVIVSYVERPDVTLEYGLRYNSSRGLGGTPSSPGDGRLQISGALELTNPTGWGWRVRPYALLTRDRHTLGAAVEAGSLFGLRVRTQLLVFDDDDNRQSATSLASRIRGVSLQQTRSLLQGSSAGRRHERLRLQWGFADKRVEYFDREGVVTSLAGKRSHLALSLLGEERDSPSDPRRGLFWTASAALSNTALGSDVDYLRLYGQLFLYVPLPGRMVWAQGYRAGVAPGDNPFLLLEDRFQAGGPTTVRGYGQNDLGRQTEDGVGLGGQGVVVLNQELRFPIWRFVAGGVFWDAGNVWDRAGDVRLGELRHSVGAGLRLMLPFGPLRLEYARRVGAEGGGGGRLVFGLGHAF